MMLACGSTLTSRMNEKQRNVINLILILLFALIIGLRYDVGTDYFTYLKSYESQHLEDFEYGFQVLNKILFFIGAPYYILFIIIAFFQLYLFYIACKDLPKLVPWVFFFYITTLYLFFSLNGMRQALAFSIIIFSLQYIKDRKIFHYCIGIVLASTFHKSAMIMLPMYFFIHYDILKTRFLQYILYFISFIIAIVFSDLIWKLASLISVYLGYESFSSSISDLKEVKWSGGVGLGKYLWIMINIMTIYYYPKLKKTFSSKIFIIFYNLFFIGIILDNLVSSTYLSRMNVYFLYMKIFVYSYLMVYIFCHQKSIILKFFGVLFVIIMLLFFYVGIHNKASQCAPFMFVG